MTDPSELRRLTESAALLDELRGLYRVIHDIAGTFTMPEDRERAAARFSAILEA